jgi:hypothetical protein
MEFPVLHDTEPERYIILTRSRSHFLVPSTTAWDFKQAFKNWQHRKHTLLDWLRSGRYDAPVVQRWGSKIPPTSVLDLEGWNRSSPNMEFQYDPAKQEYTLLRSAVHSTALNPVFSYSNKPQWNDGASLRPSNMYEYTAGSIPNSWATSPYVGGFQSNYSVSSPHGSHHPTYEAAAGHPTNWPYFPGPHVPQPQGPGWVYHGAHLSQYPYNHSSYGYYRDNPYTAASSSSGTHYFNPSVPESESMVYSVGGQTQSSGNSNSESTNVRPVVPRSGSPLIVGHDAKQS